MRPLPAANEPSPDRSGSEPASGTVLRARCAQCSALCCVALNFQRSADFPVDKPAGVPCRNLVDDDTCAIHERLRPCGWHGCVAFDCLGAGQRVTRLFAGHGWHEDGTTGQEMFAAFGIMLGLHEMLYYLRSVPGHLRSVSTSGRPEMDAKTGQLGAQAAQLYDVVEGHAAGDPASLRALDPDDLRGLVGRLLREVSSVVRRSRRDAGQAPARYPRRVGPSADLAGVALRGRDLRAADLRGAVLIDADLRDADLSCADLLGTDLRRADVRGADLSRALFLTPGQEAGMRTEGPGCPR